LAVLKPASRGEV